MLNLYLKQDAELLGPPRIDGELVDTPPPAVWPSPTQPPEHLERGKKVWSGTLAIPPDEDGSLTFDYRVPGVVRTVDGSRVYHLVVQHQPKVQPETLVVRLKLPEGASGDPRQGVEARRGRAGVGQAPDRRSRPGGFVARVRAAILAAGRGVRMGGGTPKTLIPVADDKGPLLQYILEGLQKAGITDLLVVTGHRAAEVECYVTDKWGDDNLTFVRNMRYASWGNFHSVRVALDQSPGSRPARRELRHRRAPGRIPARDRDSEAT